MKQPSNNQDGPDTDDDLERMLRLMMPSAVSRDFETELIRDWQRTAVTSPLPDSRPNWWRLVPLTAMGLIAGFCYFFLSHLVPLGTTTSPTSIAAEAPPTSLAPVNFLPSTTSTLDHDTPSSSSRAMFLPASARGLSSGGTVILEDFPLRDRHLPPIQYSSKFIGNNETYGDNPMRP